MLVAAILQQHGRHAQHLQAIVQRECRICRKPGGMLELQVLARLDVLRKKILKAIEQGDPVEEVALHRVLDTAGRHCQEKPVFNNPMPS